MPHRACFANASPIFRPSADVFACAMFDSTATTMPLSRRVNSDITIPQCRRRRSGSGGIRAIGRTLPPLPLTRNPAAITGFAQLNCSDQSIRRAIDRHTGPMFGRDAHHYFPPPPHVRTKACPDREGRRECEHRRLSAGTRVPPPARRVSGEVSVRAVVVLAPVVRPHHARRLPKCGRRPKERASQAGRVVQFESGDVPRVRLQGSR